MKSILSSNPELSLDPDQRSEPTLVHNLSKKTDLFVFIYSPQQKSLISWSDNAREVLGVKDSDILKDGNLFLRHVHPDDRFLLLTDLEKALKGKNNYRATYRWIRPDTNEIRWLHCRASLLEGESIFEGMILDLTQEFTGSVGTIAGPDSITTILSAFSTMVFTVDRDLRLLRINRAKENQAFNFGDEKFKQENFRIGRPLLAGFVDQELKAIYQRILNEMLSAQRKTYRTRIENDQIVFNLEVAPLLENTDIIGLLFVVSEITESVKIERQLASLQRVEGLGLLAAGVAHNFNNSLQAILGHASVISRHSYDQDLVQKASQSILEVVSRASGLSRQLLSFDHSTTSATESLDLNLICMSALNKIPNLFNSGIRVSVAFGNPDIVLANQQELVQAIEAIIKNAIEQMGQSNFGSNLSVKTSVVSLKEFEIQDLKAGNFARVSISDDGPGMSDETRKRCLEPFFTTKESDPSSGVGIKAKGMGLSTAFAIVRKYNGGLSIESRPNQGTNVSLYFPSINTDFEPNNQVVKSNDLKIQPVNLAQPKVLLIDDDKMVLDTVQSIINDLGYACVSCDNSNSAIEYLNKYVSSLEVVLIDAIMPGMDGPTLLKKILKQNSKLKVFGFSGATQEHTQLLLNAGALQILSKPVTVQEISQALSQFLK